MWRFSKKLKVISIAHELLCVGLVLLNLSILTSFASIKV
jgi:hypothetical protein